MEASFSRQRLRTAAFECGTPRRASATTPSRTAPTARWVGRCDTTMDVRGARPTTPHLTPRLISARRPTGMTSGGWCWCSGAGWGVLQALRVAWAPGGLFDGVSAPGQLLATTGADGVLKLWRDVARRGGPSGATCVHKVEHDNNDDDEVRGARGAGRQGASPACLQAGGRRTHRAPKTVARTTRAEDGGAHRARRRRWRAQRALKTVAASRWCRARRRIALGGGGSSSSPATPCPPPRLTTFAR